MSVRELHLHPLLVSEACDTDNVAHAGCGPAHPQPGVEAPPASASRCSSSGGRRGGAGSCAAHTIFSADVAAARPAYLSGRRCCHSAAGHAVLWRQHVSTLYRMRRCRPSRQLRAQSGSAQKASVLHGWHAWWPMMRRAPAMTASSSP